jgi:hypothetical protein
LTYVNKLGKVYYFTRKRVCIAVIVKAWSANGTTNVKKMTVKVDAIPPTTPKRSKKLIACLLVTDNIGFAVN